MKSANRFLFYSKSLTWGLTILCIVSGFLVTGQTSRLAGLKKLSSIQVSGITTTRFLYGADGKIKEVQSEYNWEKFYYDARGHISKVESYTDPGIFAGSARINTKTELCDSEKTPATAYQLFEYNSEGKVVKVDFYGLTNGVFERRSFTTYLYEKGKVLKSSLHGVDSVVTQFTVYQYDEKGNMITEDYYACDPAKLMPKMISKTLYEHDDKINPYQIYEAIYHVNLNNTVKSTFISFDQSFSKPIIKEMHYEYNDEGLPVKERAGNTLFRLQYN
jgi:hypothetical protein